MALRLQPASLPWAVAVALVGLGCGDDAADTIDAATAVPDVPLSLPVDAAGSDAAPVDGAPDAGVPDATAPDAALKNPDVLWLHGIGGSESNLELIGKGPPAPF